MTPLSYHTQIHSKIEEIALKQAQQSQHFLSYQGYQRTIYPA